MGGMWPSSTQGPYSRATEVRGSQELPTRQTGVGWGVKNRTESTERGKESWWQEPSPGENVAVPGPSTTVGLCTAQGVWGIPGQGCSAFPVGCVQAQHTCQSHHSRIRAEKLWWVQDTRAAGPVAAGLLALAIQGTCNTPDFRGLVCPSPPSREPEP